MKKHFQKIYNETGKKPFTLLNCLLCVIFPLIALTCSAILRHQNKNLGQAVLIGGIIIGLGMNFVLMLITFKKKGILLSLFTIAASYSFFLTLVFGPLISFFLHTGKTAADGKLGTNIASANYCFQAAMAATHSYPDAPSAKAHALKSTAHTAKKSAFDWFKYEEAPNIDFTILN